MSVFRQFRTALSKRIVNFPGWRTTKKIVVFESDDWGAIRIPSQDVLKKLCTSGISVDDPFSKFDSLESQADLEQLFYTLKSVRDTNGSNPVFSANCVISNPDFEKIANSGFKQYYYESVIESFRKYSNHSNCFALWQDGLKDNIFYPQYHGREHLNPSRWLTLLNSNNTDFKYAFALSTYAINYNESINKRNNLMAALDYDDDVQKKEVQKAVLDGLNLFNELLGIKSISFTPPCYIWDLDIERILAEQGIRFIKTSKIHKIPNSGKNYIKRFHYTGEKNSFQQYYQVRNCYFEPALRPDLNWIKACINSMEISFRYHKPAIISTHRLNYIGSIDESNRRRNLRLLKELLQNIVLKWPEVEFMNSTDLGNMISKSNNN